MQVDLTIFPALNASLNGASGLLLVVGHNFIQRKRIAAHRACMLAAFGCSTIFLACYLYYHLHAGVIKFQGHGWIRPVYFTLLLSHTILAVIVVPMVLVTLARALRSDFLRHRAIARWTYPIWLYVSVTGVLVYFFVYHWFR
jgi:putative membrane protein